MKSAILAVGLVFASTAAFATDAPKGMIEYAQTQFQTWIEVPEVVNAIRAQNIRTADLSEDDIVALDNTWRAEVTSNGAMVAEVLGNALSKYLSGKVESESQVIREVFVMDARGLNVGQSAATSDYWQGDEAKHQQTYGVGPGAMHASPIELDESTQAYQGQVSFSITDPDSGEVIGAVTFGVDAQPFF